MFHVVAQVELTGVKKTLSPMASMFDALPKAHPSVLCKNFVASISFTGLLHEMLILGMSKLLWN